jgi:hypothetical protein
LLCPLTSVLCPLPSDPPRLGGAGFAVANLSLPSYGVGEGDSEADGDASVSAAFSLAVFFGDADGDGEASVVVAFFFFLVEVAVVAVVFLVVDADVPVDVAMVSFFCAQEVKNATVASAVIKDKTDVFIRCGLTSPQTDASKLKPQAINGATGMSDMSGGPGSRPGRSV